MLAYVWRRTRDAETGAAMGHDKNSQGHFISAHIRGTPSFADWSDNIVNLAVFDLIGSESGSGRLPTNSTFPVVFEHYMCELGYFP
jgi:hypothetical protein